LVKFIWLQIYSSTTVHQEESWKRAFLVSDCLFLSIVDHLNGVDFENPHFFLSTQVEIFCSLGFG